MSNVTEFAIRELKKPMTLKWKVQRAIPNKTNPTHVAMVGYIDSRDVQDHLDNIIGPENWQVEYFEVKGKQFCRIGIKYEGEWIWKGDSGSPSEFEKEKGETSDAFKRAAVHWGINRYGYETGEVLVKAKLHTNGKPYPCDDQGNWVNKEALNQYCNDKANVGDKEIEFAKDMETFKNAAAEMNAKKESIRGVGSGTDKKPTKKTTAKLP